MTNPIALQKQLTANKFPLDLSSEAFGELRESNDCLLEPEVLRTRMAEDGYIFLRGYLPSEKVVSARLDVLKELALQGLLDLSCPINEARVIPSKQFKKVDFDSKKLPAVCALNSSEQMLEFYRLLLGGKVRSFDHYWVRALSPNSKSETVHCDIVYMGQGTQNLFTSWTPLGDVPREQGPLMILEKSHLLERVTSTYCQWDVDNNRNRWRFKHGQLFRGAHYSRNPPAVQREFGLRWLTTDFQVGDLLVFSAYTMHCALDNVSDVVRVSTDARYQLASEPIDQRWVGDNPKGNKSLKNNDVFSKLNIPYRFLLKLLQN